MRNVSLAIVGCLFAAACATPEQSVGTVVGGVAGAAVTAPGGPLDPGYCYVRDRHGNIRYHADGTARVRRC
jgi:hypothetical protein